MTATEVTVVIGAGEIGQAIARRVSVDRHVVLADVDGGNAERAAENLANVGFEAEAASGGSGLPWESAGSGAEESDPLYDEAVAFVIKSRRASISAVQRQLRIGYNRAARLIEQMEGAGLVSAMETNGNRTVLAPPQQE